MGLLMSCGANPILASVDIIYTVTLPELFEIGDHLGAVALGIDLAIDLGDVAGGIDDKCVAARHADEEEGPVSVVGLGNGAVVGEQGKRQIEFGCKSTVALGVVEADAQ